MPERPLELVSPSHDAILPPPLRPARIHIVQRKFDRDIYVLYKFVMSCFRKYIKWRGGVPEAAKALKRTPGSLYHVLAGRRSVTRSLAEKIEQDSQGRFRKERLMFEKP